MIGPYLAVLLDSFRAALASRVLWVAFFAIWVLLAALAPIGYHEDFTTRFRWNDFENGTQMKHILGRAIAAERDDDAGGDATREDVNGDGADLSPVARIAKRLPEDLRRPLRRVGDGEEVRIPLRDFADAFNELIDDESWYDRDAWSTTLRLRELRELNELPEEQLDESLRQRRARLRIEAALPGVFRSRASRSIRFSYAGYDFPADVAVDKTRFVSLINQWVMPTLINWLLGFALVFLGILVTASIIPEMLQPGSLHLLLSKPVSRTLLLLSKFLGGCAFVFLCVTQLVIGLWLISGFRLDIWNARLLWCIPVSVFLFSVFYSVSVVAGLRWRSSILAIGITCIFGAICLTVGVIGGLFDSLVTRPQSLSSLTVAGDTLIGVTRGGGLVRYDRDANEWVESIESNAMGRDRVLPPVRLGDDLVVTANVSGGRFNPYGSGSLDLLTLRPGTGWEPQPGVRLPPATTRVVACGDTTLLAVTTGGLLATTRGQVTRFDAATDSDATSESPAGSSSESPSVESSTPDGRSPEPLGSWLGGLWRTPNDPASPFEPILPEAMAIVAPASIIATPAGDGVLIASRGRLLRLAAPHAKVSTLPDGSASPPSSSPSSSDTTTTPEDSPSWRIEAEGALPGEPSRPLHVAASGDVILVAREDGPLRLFRLDSLAPIADLSHAESDTVTDVLGLGDSGRFVVVTGDGQGRIVDVRDPSEESTNEQDATLDDVPVRDFPTRKLPVGEIETLTFDPAAGQIVVAHHVDRVTRVDPDDGTIIDEISPAISGWRRVDRYVVTPLRTVVPQTGELGQTVTAIVSGKSSASISGGSNDGEERIRYRIARPVLSCAGFIVVMLSIGCVYFARRDF